MEKTKPIRMKIFTNGIFAENPVLRLVLGTCPTLAVSVTLIGSFGMGVVATLVLICSNAVISALRGVIPEKVRIPCYITIIAAFVTVMSMLVEAFTPDLYKTLGIYLDLIVVNCIILGRAEMFASKNTVLNSVVDGLGMGLGFTAAMLVMGFIRELFGAGTLFGLRVIPEDYVIAMLKDPPGGFLIFGVVMGLLVLMLNRKNKKNGKPALDPKMPGCNADCNACMNAGSGLTEGGAK